MSHSNSFAYVGFAKQAVAGTAVAPTDFCRWKTVTAGPMQKVEARRDGQNRDNAFVVKLGQWHELSWQTYLYPAVSSKLLCYLLGATDVVTGAADPYSHTGNSSNGLSQLLSFEHSMGNGNHIDRIADCYLEEYKVSAKAGAEALLDLKAIGRLTAPQTPGATVTYEADRPFTFIDGSATVTGATVASADVTDIELDIKQTIDQTPTLGAVQPQLLPGAREVGVTLEVLVPDDKLYRDVWFGGDAGTTVQTTPLTIASLVLLFDLLGTPDHQLQLTLNNIAGQATKQTYDVNGKPFLVTFTGTAYVGGAAEQLSYTAKNAVATAY